ncbi:hypothetical protein [Sorangium sp. So ce128]|uniref:hypothetical protein n=1 Tax=Sorangium sp. So ce128 TaxID=3133281 RepID=UPI003F5EB01A
MTMPRPMSVFVDFCGDEGVLLSALTEILGCSLVKEEIDVGVLYRGRLLDTEVVLFGDHGLDDDCGIKFSEYMYQLKLVAFDSGMRLSSYDRMYESVVVFVAERLCERLHSRTQVVVNLQRIVATFDPGAGADCSQ